MMAAKKPALTDEEITAAADYFGDSILDNRPGDTKWKKGRSGNPRGRPVQPDGLTDTLLWRLGRTGIRRLADKLIEKAVEKGDLQAITYIYDRIEGKPRQSVDNTTNEQPLIVTLLHKLVADDSALQGRTLPAGRALGAIEAPHAVDAEEVRTLTS